MREEQPMNFRFFLNPIVIFVQHDSPRCRKPKLETSPDKQQGKADSYVVASVTDFLGSCGLVAGV